MGLQTIQSPALDKSAVCMLLEINNTFIESVLFISSKAVLIVMPS